MEVDPPQTESQSSVNFLQPQSDRSARRIRLKYQTPEEKVAWDEESKQIKNAKAREKAREKREREKIEKEA